MAKRRSAIVLIAMLAAVAALGASVGQEASRRSVGIPAGILVAHAANEDTASTGSKRIRTQARSKDSHAERRERKIHRAVNQRKVAEDAGYKKVSSLVNFPTFFPGLGIIYVRPDTLPSGPFLCFDRRDRLIATVYMIPTQDINDHKKFDLTGFAGTVNHVSLYFNEGHPGVDMPHYHIVIWHVSKKDEARVAE